MDSAENKQNFKKKWLTWAGLGLFTFFLAKGLLWLSLPALLVWFGTR